MHETRSNYPDPLCFGISAQGRKEYTALTQGKRLTARQAILAKCYECTCGYQDGKEPCLVPGCPLEPFMPYRVGGAVKRPTSEKQKKVGAENVTKSKIRSQCPAHEALQQKSEDSLSYITPTPIPRGIG